VTGSNVAIALIHYPVYDRNHKTVVSAITNLDLHDIARAARTFGIARYYIVTPATDQQLLAGKIVGHWQNGYGATYNPKRKTALDLVTVKDTLAEAVLDFEVLSGAPVKLVATGAAAAATTTYSGFREEIRTSTAAHLLLFGTGWGLDDEIMDAADVILPPLRGPGEYNHLSVRSAASIILDRLFGQ
jgi:hypothetical protein